MEARGFSPNAGPTAVMRSEHEQGRRYMKEMADAVKQGEAGEPTAIIPFAKNARAYSAMLRLHIQKEDNCLFPMAESALSESDTIELLRQFDETEQSHELAGQHEKFLQLADEDRYTGHCWRRSSATILADAGGDKLLLKRHGRWTSDSVAEGYIDGSKRVKSDTAKVILNAEKENEDPRSSDNTTPGICPGTKNSFAIPKGVPLQSLFVNCNLSNCQIVLKSRNTENNEKQI